MYKRYFLLDLASPECYTSVWDALFFFSQKIKIALMKYFFRDFSFGTLSRQNFILQGILYMTNS